MAPREPVVKLVVAHDEPASWMAPHPWVWAPKDKLRPSALLNVTLMIEHHPELAGIFELDLFRDQIRLTRPLPGYEVGEYPRELTDHDETALTAWLNRVGLFPSIQSTGSAIRKVAFANTVDPMSAWLNSLVWDGTKRVDGWLNYYAGAELTDYTRTIGRRFMVGAVARAMNPGCKNDTMMVLEGPQGLLKSSLVRELAGPEWFSDQIGDITNKDSCQLIQGKWMVEVPEMDKLNRQEANAVKDFLSRREDRYRPPYGRNVVTRARRGVFVGTINPNGIGYLKDTTGGRRFWPVEVTCIDLEALKMNRSQLWAEAVALFKRAEPWWLTKEETPEAMAQQAQRLDDDVWEPKVLDWVTGTLDGFTSADVLRDALGVDTRAQSQREKIRVANILTAAGYVNRTVREGKFVRRVWTRL